MTKQEREAGANKAYNLLFEASEILNEIIWERQEGQPEHFDKLSKLEQIKLITSRALIISSLQQVDSWKETLDSL